MHLPRFRAPRAAVRPVVAPAVALSLALSFALVACGGPEAPAGGPPGGGMPPLPVTLLQVQPRSVPVTIETVATIEGLREVEVRARVAGVIEQQRYREGEPVRAGAALFRIERAPLQIAVDAARAAVAQAEARAEQARREVTRQASLVAEGMVSQNAADVATSNAKAAEAALLSARAALRDAELNLSYTEVDAPVAGVAQRALKSVGSLVSPGADGGLLTTIVQLDPVRVRFALTADEAAQVRRAKASVVRLLGPDGRPIGAGGRLDFSGSVVDAQLGTVPMRAEIANPDGAWLPGQFARAQVVVGEVEAFVVPQSAVMSGDQGRFVWVAVDGKATPKPVETGPWLGRDWVIRSGLSAGDAVIVDNLLKLRPGAPVQAAPAAAPQAAPAAPTAPASAPSAPSR